MNWLTQYIDYKKITVFKLEKKIGVRSTIQKAINNNSNLGSNLLAKIVVEFPDINPDWLLTGKGEMLRNSEELQVDCKQEIVKIQKELDFKTEQVNFYQEKSIDLQKKLEDCENEKKRINTIS